MIEQTPAPEEQTQKLPASPLRSDLAGESFRLLAGCGGDGGCPRLTESEEDKRKGLTTAQILTISPDELSRYSNDYPVPSHEVVGKIPTSILEERELRLRWDRTAIPMNRGIIKLADSLPLDTARAIPFTEYTQALHSASAILIYSASSLQDAVQPDSLHSVFLKQRRFTQARALITMSLLECAGGAMDPIRVKDRQTIENAIFGSRAVRMSESEIIEHRGVGLPFGEQIEAKTRSKEFVLVVGSQGEAVVFTRHPMVDSTSTLTDREAATLQKHQDPSAKANHVMAISDCSSLAAYQGFTQHFLQVACDLKSATFLHRNASLIPV